MRRIVVAVAVLVGLVAVQAVTAATASAHAELVSASPANGAMLAGPPDAVELVFSETVGRPAELVVLGPDGSEIEGGELEVVDATMRRAYDPAEFDPGSYTVSYQVTSADGHPISGSLSFMVHGDGEATMDEAAGGVGGSTVTDADPTTVVVLALGLAIALGVALLATRRMVSRPDPDHA